MIEFPKKKYFITFTLIIIAIVSCQNKEDNKQEESQKKVDTTEYKSLLIQKQIDSIKSYRESIFSEKKKSKQTFFVNNIECFWDCNIENKIILYGKPKNYNNIFRLLVLSNNKQSNNFEKKWYTNQIDSEFKDVNFDGKKDFIIYSQEKSGNGGKFYDVFTFFIKEYRFDYSKELSGGNLLIDYKAKTATNFWKVGARQNIQKTFSFRGDGGIYHTYITEKIVKNIDSKDYLISRYKKYKNYSNSILESKIDTIEFNGW